MSKAKEFDPAEQVIVIENFIKQYFAENGTPETKAVIGISGGKDSTIAAALLVRTLGPDRVIGVMMPEYEQSDIEEVCKEIIDSLTLLKKEKSRRKSSLRLSRK